MDRTADDIRVRRTPMDRAADRSRLSTVSRVLIGTALVAVPVALIVVLLAVGPGGGHAAPGTAAAAAA
ncbi:MAG: hypothetical protein QOI74_160, partial [Micromonosporaceae bacterium]|nr:hypothetical protein [Micromonosporaceae bacterium]